LHIRVAVGSDICAALGFEHTATALANVSDEDKVSAVASRGARYWLVHVPEIDEYTQARNDAEIEPMARDLIATWLNVPRQLGRDPVYSTRVTTTANR